jgi:hypothetical protein
MTHYGCREEIARLRSELSQRDEQIRAKDEALKTLCAWLRKSAEGHAYAARTDDPSFEEFWTSESEAHAALASLAERALNSPATVQESRTVQPAPETATCRARVRRPLAIEDLPGAVFDTDCGKPVPCPSHPKRPEPGR